MDSNIKKPIIVAYGGTLDAYSDTLAPSNSFLAPLWKFLKQWLWTYRRDTVDSSTRTGYYLFKAVKYLKDHYKITSDDLQLNFWGLIREGNKVLAEEWEITDIVKFGGYCSKQESLAKLAEADIMFLPLERGTNGQQTLFIPGKLYEYLNLGKPILALAEPSDCQEIIIKSGLGIVITPNDEKLIGENLLNIIRDRNILTQYKPNKTYIEEFNSKLLVGKLARIFDELLS
ncbi:MAG: glycosyltransferase [Bacteroidia bacterium]